MVLLAIGRLRCAIDLVTTPCGRGGSLGLKTGLSTGEAGGISDEDFLLGLDSLLLDGEWTLGSGAR